LEREGRTFIEDLGEAGYRFICNKELT